MLDIRIPIGLLFALLGPILIVFGLVADPVIYREHSLGMNVNFWWGLVLSGFAAVMLTLAHRARRKTGGTAGPGAGSEG